MIGSKRTRYTFSTMGLKRHSAYAGTVGIVEEYVKWKNIKKEKKGGIKTREVETVVQHLILTFFYFFLIFFERKKRG